jgi:hypothetical protein
VNRASSQLATTAAAYDAVAKPLPGRIGPPAAGEGDAGRVRVRAAAERGRQDWALADVHDTEAFLATLPRARTRRRGVPPRALRCTRLAGLVITMDAELVAAAFGVRHGGVMVCLAGHVGDGRLL